MAKSNLDKEIEEILARLDKFPQEGRLARTRRRLRRAFRGMGQGFSSLVPRVSVSQLAIVGAVLLALALLFRSFIGGLAPYALIAGLVLLGIAFLLSIRGAGAGRPGYRYEKRWRGRVVDDLSGAGLGSRIRDWFRRPSRKDRQR